MSNGFRLTTEAQRWVDEAMARYGPPDFAHVASAVFWTDERGADGELLVEADPSALVASHQRDPAVVLHAHDPGRPVGQVLEVKAFVAPGGRQFVAGVVGYYGRDGVITFAELGLGVADAAPLVELDAPPNDGQIQLAADPRELPDGWLDEVMSDAPPSAVRVEMSYNAAETTQELIRIAVAFGAIWNPFVKAIATEAGKDVYAATRNWLKSVLNKSRRLKSPTIGIEGYYGGCHVSFLIRGTSRATHATAHEGLTGAAAEAATLVSRLEARGMPPASLVYEFDETVSRWYPSYARLANGRLVVDSPMLIAALQDLPKGLSLGMRKGDMHKPSE